MYGDVIDKAARKNVSICRPAEQDGGLSRVYVSQSNLLHIVFTPAASAHHHQQQQQQHNFIIHVEGKNLQMEIRKDGTFLILSCLIMNCNSNRKCAEVDGKSNKLRETMNEYDT